jgi:hypothetical protein
MFLGGAAFSVGAAWMMSPILGRTMFESIILVTGMAVMSAGPFIYLDRLAREKE